jgi:hypothetical protein
LRLQAVPSPRSTPVSAVPSPHFAPVRAIPGPRPTPTPPLPAPARAITTPSRALVLRSGGEVVTRDPLRDQVVTGTTITRMSMTKSKAKFSLETSGYILPDNGSIENSTSCLADSSAASPLCALGRNRSASTPKRHGRRT